MPVLLREDSHRLTVENCIQSIKDNSIDTRDKENDYELIIVDDASPLMTGFLKDEADVYIRHKYSKGIAPSWNDGIAVSRGEYIAVINDDILLPKPAAKFDTWLNFMSLVFGWGGTDNKDCGVVAPRLGGPNITPLLEEGGEWIVNHKFYPGYCFMLKRDRFLEKFDETFIPYNGEDTDYWWRIMQKGLKLYRAPMEIWHKEGDVVHNLGNYEKRSKEANEWFERKHGVDPVSKFYS